MNKNKTVLLLAFAILALCTTAITCYYIYSSNNRFVTSSIGSGRFVVTDKRTGDVKLITGNNLVNLEEQAKEKEISPSQKVINHVRASNSIGDYLNRESYSNKKEYRQNSDLVEKYAKQLTGNISFFGWRAGAAEDANSYVVTYEWDNAGLIWGYVFEVDIATAIVRNVMIPGKFTDKALYKKHTSTLENLRKH